MAENLNEVTDNIVRKLLALGERNLALRVAWLNLKVHIHFARQNRLIRKIERFDAKYDEFNEELGRLHFESQLAVMNPKNK